VFNRFFCPSEPPEPDEEFIMRFNNDAAYEALYGPHTRSGEVVRVIDYCDEPWIHWDGIQWDWPSAVFNIEEFEDGFVYQIKRAFEVTLKSGESVHIVGPAFTVH
jgi:hypothetical protein